MDGEEKKDGENVRDDFGMLDDDWIIDDIGGGLGDDIPESERVEKGRRDGFVKEMGGCI